MKKETGIVHSVEQVPALLVNDEKLKDPTDVANAFNNLFTTITEKLNIQKIVKGGTISILKDSLPWNFPSIDIIAVTETEMQSIIHSQKPKKSSGYDEITSKILRACASVISHPLR
jgi:hypothetical protein